MKYCCWCYNHGGEEGKPCPNCGLNGAAALPPARSVAQEAEKPNLSDNDLLVMWRSVQGPNAGLTGPLIRFAALVFKAVRQQVASDLNWVRAQRDVAEAMKSSYHDQPCAVCGIKRAAHPGMGHAFELCAGDTPSLALPTEFIGDDEEEWF